MSKHDILNERGTTVRIKRNKSKGPRQWNKANKPQRGGKGR